MIKNLNIASLFLIGLYVFSIGIITSFSDEVLTAFKVMPNMHLSGMAKFYCVLEFVLTKASNIALAFWLFAFSKKGEKSFWSYVGLVYGVLGLIFFLLISWLQSDKIRISSATILIVLILIATYVLSPFTYIATYLYQLHSFEPAEYGGMTMLKSYLQSGSVIYGHIPANILLAVLMGKEFCQLKKNKNGFIVFTIFLGVLVPIVSAVLQNMKGNEVEETELS